MDRYHSIIIGAGHNGLVCAAYLARSGQDVLVLESADAPGGLAASREFHPGFRTSVAHSIGHFSQQIARDLDLDSHGFGEPVSHVPTVGLNIDGKHIIVSDRSLSGAGDADASAYGEYDRLMHKCARALSPFWLKTMPRIGARNLAELMTFAKVGWNIRRMGKNDMRELLRIASLPVRDLMDEFFDSDVLKSALSWDGLVGSKMAPRSPNGPILAMLYRMSEGIGGAHSMPTAALVDALCKAAASGGAEIRSASKVDRIVVDGSSDGVVAKGVQMADGEKIHADRVISATDPRRTFVDLVGVEHLDIEFTNRIRRLRCDGFVAKLHLALNDLPVFSGLEKPDGRMIIAPTMDAIEFAYDDAKYGESSAEPVMEIVVPSLHDASLAPAGQHVLSAHVMYVPYDRRGGWTGSARDQTRERAIDTIARYAPAIRDQIVHAEFLTPADLEREYNVTGGHWHHADFAMDQVLMMRPTYEAAQYATPIPGLFLCGAGSHPGGDLTGAAGHNAACEILR